MKSRKSLVSLISLSLILIVVVLSLVMACAKPVPSPTSAPAPAPAPTVKPSAAPTASVPAPSPTASPTAVKTFVLKGDTLLTQTHGVSVTVAKKFKLMEERSGGRLKFDIYYNGTLTPPDQHLTTIQRGVLDWAYAAMTWDMGLDARFEMAKMPFAWSGDKDLYKAMRTTRLGAMLEEASKKFNATLVGYSGSAGQVLFSKKPVKVMEDFKGLKVRIGGGTEAEALKNLGGVGVQVTSGEIAPAFERGIVDAMFGSYTTVQTYSLFDQIKFVNQTPWTSVSLMGVFFNLDTWNKLPKDLQQIIRDTYAGMEDDESAYWAAGENAAMVQLQKKAEFYMPPAEEITRWRQLAALPVWQGVANRIGGTEGPEFLDIMKKWHGLK